VVAGCCRGRGAARSGRPAASCNHAVVDGVSAGRFVDQKPSANRPQLPLTSSGSAQSGSPEAVPLVATAPTPRFPQQQGVQRAGGQHHPSQGLAGPRWRDGGHRRGRGRSNTIGRAGEVSSAFFLGAQHAGRPYPSQHGRRHAQRLLGRPFARRSSAHRRSIRQARALEPARPASQICPPAMRLRRTVRQGG